MKTKFGSTDLICLWPICLLILSSCNSVEGEYRNTLVCMSVCPLLLGTLQLKVLIQALSNFTCVLSRNANDFQLKGLKVNVLSEGMLGLWSSCLFFARLNLI